MSKRLHDVLHAAKIKHITSNLQSDGRLYAVGGVNHQCKIKFPNFIGIFTVQAESIGYAK